MEDEISLRDLYLMFKRQSRWILGVTVLVTVAVFVGSSLWPPTYESEAVAQALTRKGGDAAFQNLPSGAALSVGFSKQVETKGPYVARVIGNAPIEAKARFDDKKNLLTLTVRGRDPEEVRQFAQDLLAAFDDYVKDRTFQSVKANLGGALAQTRLQLSSVQAQISDLKASLAQVPRVQADSDAQTALESAGTPPNVARASNPALAYLGLELAKRQTALANLKAEADSLETLATDPSQLRLLSERAAQVNVLSPPALPEKPVAPRVLLSTALAAVLTLMLAVFLAFMREAVAAEPNVSAEPSPASHPAPDGAATTPK